MACALQEELVEAGLIKPPPEAALAVKGAAKGKKATKKAAGKAGKAGSKAGAAAACRQFTSPSGLQVLVGRNNKQNDMLSLQIANAQDIWMHIQVGRRGRCAASPLLCLVAHVLLPAAYDTWCDTWWFVQHMAHLVGVCT